MKVPNKPEMKTRNRSFCAMVLNFFHPAGRRIIPAEMIRSEATCIAFRLSNPFFISINEDPQIKQRVIKSSQLYAVPVNGFMDREGSKDSGDWSLAGNLYIERTKEKYYGIC